MPLGIISDEEFNKEIENSGQSNHNEKKIDFDNSTNTGLDYHDTNQPRTPETMIVEMPGVGRHPEVGNVPQSLRKLLGEEVAINGLKSAMHLANSVGGLSQPTLSSYGSGNISRNNPSSDGDDLTNYLNNRKSKITKKALNKLTLVMSMIDEEKLLGCDAKELSTIAKDMATVSKQMEPTVKEAEKKEPVQFIMYAPQIKNEQHYETIAAKDNF